MEARTATVEPLPQSLAPTAAVAGSDSRKMATCGACHVGRYVERGQSATGHGYCENEQCKRSHTRKEAKAVKRRLQVWQDAATAVERRLQGLRFAVAGTTAIAGTTAVAGPMAAAEQNYEVIVSDDEGGQKPMGSQEGCQGAVAEVKEIDKSTQMVDKSTQTVDKSTQTVDKSFVDKARAILKRAKSVLLRAESRLLSAKRKSNEEGDLAEKRAKREDWV
jgi:hypothetical protein